MKSLLYDLFYFIKFNLISKLKIKIKIDIKIKCIIKFNLEI